MTTGGIKSAAVVGALLLVAAVVAFSVAFSWGRGAGAGDDRSRRVAARALQQAHELESRLRTVEEELADLQGYTERFDRLSRRLDRVRDRLQGSVADLRGSLADLGGSLDGASSKADQAASEASSAASRVERVARDLSVLTERFDYHVRNH
jgi:chromosome segregation ATPase